MSDSKSLETLEIVELAGGEVVLRRTPEADGNLEPLICIYFSEETLAFLGEAKVEVSKEMIRAGIKLAGQMYQELEVEEIEIDNRILH
ncbi:MAG: hypothetical protein V4629_07775 [Pseudomonadota bacterium]